MNLKDYIRGQRQGKEANRLEREAMDDPFLQDAIDGYDSVEGDHISVIEDLEKRLSSPQKRINRRMWIWAAAAVIILLIGTPLLLYKPYTKEEITIVSSDIIQQKKESTTPSLQDDTILVADHFEPQKEKITAPLAGRAAGITVSKQEQDKHIEIRGRSTFVSQPDKIFVSGRIVDETGEPIPGVTINIPNTRTGTITDTAGNFQLIVPKDKQETLIASYIGMRNSEIPLKENVGDITMKADDIALNEVVVVGYGTRKKRLITGSVSVVKDISVRDSVSVVKDMATFGEEEFRNYFTDNYDKDICAGQNMTIVVEFFIDPMGRPGHIDIKENPCPALDSEIKRLLLGSPLWSKTNRKVTLQIELP